MDAEPSEATKQKDLDAFRRCMVEGRISETEFIAIIAVHKPTSCRDFLSWWGGGVLNARLPKPGQNYDDDTIDTVIDNVFDFRAGPNHYL